MTATRLNPDVETGTIATGCVYMRYGRIVIVRLQAYDMSNTKTKTIGYLPSHLQPSVYTAGVTRPAGFFHVRNANGEVLCTLDTQSSSAYVHGEVVYLV